MFGGGASSLFAADSAFRRLRLPSRLTISFMSVVDFSFRSAFSFSQRGGFLNGRFGFGGKSPFFGTLLSVD